MSFFTNNDPIRTTRIYSSALQARLRCVINITNPSNTRKGNNKGENTSNSDPEISASSTSKKNPAPANNTPTRMSTKKRAVTATKPPANARPIPAAPLRCSPFIMMDDCTMKYIAAQAIIKSTTQLLSLRNLLFVIMFMLAFFLF
jgi:hypothetical protein